MDSSSSEEEAIVLLAALEDGEGERKKLWTHDINLERKEKGEFHTLMPQLRLDEKRSYKYFRMGIACFDEILNPIKDDIEKRYTNLREPISAEERLAITLRKVYFCKKKLQVLVVKIKEC